MKKVNIFEIIKACIHFALAIVLFIFYEELVEHVRWLVGGVMALYAAESIVRAFTEKEHEAKEIFNGLLLILFAVIMFVHGKNYATACIVWACWSIYREGEEILEKVHESKCLPIGILNAVESIVVIVFSFMLIGEPGHHHALSHVILLGFELILAVVFPFLDENLGKKKVIKK